MLLSETEIRRSIERVNAAFPCFSDWEHRNEINDSYFGFCLWGEFVPEPDESMPRRFFITFDTYKETWTGHLTIGQHCYLWTSADFGDAQLVDTSPCAALADAIATLKRQMADLFAALSGSGAGSAPASDCGGK